ncbi:tRNA (adenosine(37)-N6)-threonylcarbamoyltransferase complex ATPase subunit type 1 TsaE [Pedobacter sp. AW1-32]|uniref:tRNA (adenosine(37)-N6)-threonylcarbamoyltransferase complex ATPase subunit type 1 TsaE n=1 Tax=Pedobacter sp. AW1-32 TaxID=3383026 RepID=UPI003FEEF7F9
MEIEVNTLEALPHVAEQLLAFSSAAKTYTFEGEMGAGKTTFIKQFCTVLGVKDVVSSPTYSIVNEYEGSGTAVYHFDFYRIKSIQEAYDMGYEEYFYGDGICLIEWPQLIEELLPQDRISVHIEIIDEFKRIFRFQKHNI